MKHFFNDLLYLVFFCLGLATIGPILIGLMVWLFQMTATLVFGKPF